MKPILWIATLVALCSFLFQDAARAHGGTYRGPGSTVPPGGGSSGSGSSGSSGSPTNPGTPGPQGPKGGAGGSTGGSNQPTSPGSTGTPTLPSGTGQAEWELWWAFNRDPFLNLKAVLHEGDLLPGSDNFFLGHAPADAARDRLRPSPELIETRIVPALLEILEKETDNDLVTGAMIALAKIGADPSSPGQDDTVERLQELLASPNQETSETAAVALGILADPAALPILHSLLADEAEGRALVGGHEVNWRTRAFAAYGLGLVGYRSADVQVQQRVVGILAKSLAGPAQAMATPDVAVGCLVAYGLVALPFDAQCLLKPEHEPVPTHCRRCQVEWLLEFSRRPGLNYKTSAHTPTALARLVARGDADPDLKRVVGEELLRLASSSKVHRERRAGAILALGLVGDADGSAVDTKIVSSLTEIVRTSRELQARTLALIALGQAGGRRGDAAISETEVLDEVRATLLEVFQEGRSADRTWAALALGLLERAVREAGLPPSKEAGNALRSSLARVRTPREVGAFAVALGIMRDAESSKTLLAKLDAIADDRARGYLCIALGLCDARQSIDPLRDLLLASRYRPLLLREAAISLGLLGDKELVGDLVAQLQQATSISSQSSIAAALGSIGDARSIDPLLEMLGDADLNVRGRAFAAVALGIVADKEPLPWNAKFAVGANYSAGVPTLTDGQGKGILDIL